MIYLASYKSTHKGWHGLINRGIRRITRSKHSHSEACLGNPFESAVPCLSSSGVDGGVRIKEMQLNPDKWDIEPMSWVTEDMFWETYYKYKDDKYDYLGCGWFAAPWIFIESYTRKFCTEIVAILAGYQDPWRFAPGTFHIIVKARNE